MLLWPRLRWQPCRENDGTGNSAPDDPLSLHSPDKTLRTTLAGCVLASVRGRRSSGHRDKEPRKVGDQPDRPNNNAEPVKADNRLLILANQDSSCPDGMDNHQQDGEYTCQAVDIESDSAWRNDT